MRPVTLIYCLRDEYVLLAMKKRGFGAGKLNGYGGKVHDGETILQAACRELKEESGMKAKPSDLEKVAEIDFYFSDVPAEKNWNQTVHVYFLKKWKGEPKETEEMKPEWHEIKSPPMDKFWASDPHWFPYVLDGKKIKASFTFGEQGATVVDKKIEEVSSF